MSTHQDNILELMRMLQQQQDFVNSVKDPTFGYIRNRLNQHVSQDLAWLAMITGNPTISANSGRESTTDNPLLNTTVVHKIMGKEVGGSRRPVTSAMLTPSKDDTARFVAQVNDLYAGFLALKDRDIISIVGKPGGIALIRGVAKKAGLADWEARDSSEIDVAFFADIRSGIRQNNISSELNASIDAELQHVDAVEDTDDEEQEAVIPKKAASKKSATPKKTAATKKEAPKFDDEDDE